MSDDVVICSRCFARAAKTDSYAPTCFQGVEHDWQPGGVPRPPDATNVPANLRAIPCTTEECGWRIWITDVKCPDGHIQRRGAPEGPKTYGEMLQDGSLAELIKGQRPAEGSLCGKLMTAFGHSAPCVRKPGHPGDHDSVRGDNLAPASASAVCVDCGGPVAEFKMGRVSDPCPKNVRGMPCHSAPASAPVGRQEGMTVAAAKRALPCDPHGLTPKKHCREMERMLREVGDPFLSGEGDSPHEAVRRLREAYDEAREELVSASHPAASASAEELRETIERVILQLEAYAPGSKAAWCRNVLLDAVRDTPCASPEQTSGIGGAQSEHVTDDQPIATPSTSTTPARGPEEAGTISMSPADRMEWEEGCSSSSSAADDDGVHDDGVDVQTDIRESIARYLEHIGKVDIGTIRLGALFTADQVPRVIASWIRNRLDEKWKQECLLTSYTESSSGPSASSPSSSPSDGPSHATSTSPLTTASLSSSLEDEERAFTWLTQRSSLVTVVSLAALLADVRRGTVEACRRETVLMIDTEEWGQNGAAALRELNRRISSLTKGSDR